MWTSSLLASFNISIGINFITFFKSYNTEISTPDIFEEEKINFTWNYQLLMQILKKRQNLLKWRKVTFRINNFILFEPLMITIYNMTVEKLLIIIITENVSQICQWLATDRLFSLGTPVFSTKTEHHNITEILLKVALNTLNLKMCQ